MKHISVLLAQVQCLGHFLVILGILAKPPWEIDSWQNLLSESPPFLGFKVLVLVKILPNKLSTERQTRFELHLKLFCQGGLCTPALVRRFDASASSIKTWVKCPAGKISSPTNENIYVQPTTPKQRGKREALEFPPKSHH